MRHLLIILLSALLVATASPAVAETITVDDPPRDHVPPRGQNFRGAGDVIRVRVAHAPRRVRVKAVFRKRPYDVLEVDIDTRSSRPGAEFLLLKTPYGVSLWRSGKQRQTRVACRGKGLRRPSSKTWVAFVNRRCLDTRKGRRPRQVRVHVLSASEDYYFTRDHVPGRQRFSRWVRRG